MKMKHLMLGLALSAVIGLAAGCGKKKEADVPVVAPPPDTKQATDATAQSEADAMVAQRAIDRAKSLVEQKSYPDAIAQFKYIDTLKLTPAQRAVVDALRAQVPK
jgi:hypothetical protein